MGFQLYGFYCIGFVEVLEGSFCSLPRVYKFVDSPHFVRLHWSFTRCKVWRLIPRSQHVKGQGLEFRIWLIKVSGFDQAPLLPRVLQMRT